MDREEIGYKLGKMKLSQTFILNFENPLNTRSFPMFL